MFADQFVVEISSEDETPKNKKKRQVPANEDGICVDSSEPTTSKNIAITIEQRRGSLRPAPPPVSTRITIRFQDEEDEDSHPPPAAPAPAPHTHPKLLAMVPERRQSSDESDFTDFVQLCLLLERSEDMERVVEKKLKYYYALAAREYVTSKRFCRFLAHKKNQLRADSTNLWVHIKDVVDALKAHKKVEQRVSLPEKESDPVVEEKIRALEEKMRLLRELVQRIDQQEVDWEEDDRSSYIKSDKYKARLVSAYAELCRLRGVSASSHSRVRLERRPGRAQAPAHCLEDWVNRPVARGLPPRFPDYHDVLSCVRDACRRHQLPWSDLQIHVEARELFVSCGRALQRKRRGRDKRLAAELLAHTLADPADSDTLLHSTLQHNALISAQRERQVFDEFENKEILLKGSTRKDKTNKSDSSCTQTNIDKNEESSSHGESEREEASGCGGGGGVRGDLITARRESSESECVLVSDASSHSSTPTHSHQYTLVSSVEAGTPSPLSTINSDSSDSECVIIEDS